MATSHVAYKQSFGFDAPPYTYADFEQSDVLIFVGSNPCIAHPIMWQRVMQNSQDPTIIVIDPRKTETAMAATIHLPIQPKSDLVLLYGLAKILSGRGTSSQWHTQSRTAKSDVLRKLYPEHPYVEVNPVDAKELGIDSCDRVMVSTRRGSLTATALVTSTVPPGSVFLPMHYPEVNRLTIAVFDLHSRQPSYKACAARLEI